MSSFFLCRMFGVFLAVRWTPKHQSLATVLGPIAGLVVGVVGGVVVANVVFWSLDRLLSPAPRLSKHIVRDDPHLIRDLAEFLDSVREQRVWTSQTDDRLETPYQQQSLDEGLVQEAFDAATELKKRIRGERGSEKSLSVELQELNFEELRLELTAIARDLRLAAG